jgi:hypothetical protein
MGFDNWAAILNPWTLTDEIARFEGAPDAAGRAGLAVSPYYMAAGEVAVTITTDAVSDSADAVRPGGFVVFGYDPASRAGFAAGIGGSGEYSVFQVGLSPEVTDKVSMLASAGDVASVAPGRPYHLRVRVAGGRATVSVDGTHVLDLDLPEAPPGQQLGFWALGGAPVTFSDFQYVGEPGRLFVVMQFGAPYDDLYNEVIVPVAAESGLTASRADEMSGPGIILSDIVREIRESTAIVAEITPANPNVYYEVGYAHAAGTPTILLVRRGQELPFDVRSFRCIIYDDSIAGKPQVETQLRKHLEAITASRPPLIPPEA